MDSKDYWLKREQEHAKQLRKIVSKKTEDIMKEYKWALSNIEADINRNFVHYAKDGNMTMADAMKLADKMDIERFADKAKQYVQEMDNSPQANADLKLYNLKMRVSRLQLLKSEINLEIDRLAGKLNSETEKHLRKVAMNEYRRQAGILGKHLTFNDRKVNALVNASYKLNNGFVTFSDNVWHNAEMLKARLGNVLNSAILQGKNPNQYISDFVKIFNAQPYQVGRLLITETARLQGDVQLDSYKQGEIEWYDISYESSACRICRRAASGGPYRFDRAVIGHNMYPFHPNCLCSIMPAEEPKIKYSFSNYDKADYSQLSEETRKRHDKYIGELSPKLKSSLTKYTTNFYEQINKPLRENVIMSDEAKKVADDLDKALKFEIGQNILLRRNLWSFPNGIFDTISADKLEALDSVLKFDKSDFLGVSDRVPVKEVNDVLYSLKGARFKDKAYSSTSTDITGESFGHGQKVGLYVMAPEKSNGLLIESLSQYATEKEVLLPRNTLFEVLDVRVGNKNSVELLVKVIEDEE